MAQFALNTFSFNKLLVLLLRKSFRISEIRKCPYESNWKLDRRLSY